MRHVPMLRRATATAALALALGGMAAAGHAKCTRTAEECAAAMKETYQTKGWSGIESEDRDDGFVQVLSVIPDGPADQAGIKAGDVLVSMNGVTFNKANAARIAEMKRSGLRIGDRVSYGVMRDREITTVKLALERIPDAILAGLIARHAREEHHVARN